MNEKKFDKGFIKKDKKNAGKVYTEGGLSMSPETFDFLNKIAKSSQEGERRPKDLGAAANIQVENSDVNSDEEQKGKKPFEFSDGVISKYTKSNKDLNLSFRMDEYEKEINREIAKKTEGGEEVDVNEFVSDFLRKKRAKKLLELFSSDISKSSVSETQLNDKNGEVPTASQNERAVRSEGKIFQQISKRITEIKSEILDRLNKSFEIKSLNKKHLDEAKHWRDEILVPDNFSIENKKNFFPNVFSEDEKNKIAEHIRLSNEEIFSRIQERKKELEEFIKIFESDNEIKEVPISWKLTDKILEKINNYEDLNDSSKEEAEKKINQKFREFWKDFVVHGRVENDPETGKTTVVNFTDLDGKCSLALLEMAGMDVKNVSYVAPESFERGKINIDTGNREGVVIEDETIFIDHHGVDYNSRISSTKLTYETLVELGLLKKEEYLDNLVDFVTKIDNGDHPDMMNYFKNSWRTITGLYRFMKTPKLIDFFKDRNRPEQVLTNEELKKYGLIFNKKDKKSGKIEKIDFSSRQKKIVEKAKGDLERMEKEGLVLDSKKYGKIAVDVINGKDRENAGGFFAAKAYGYGAYVIWNGKSRSFFVSSVNKIEDDFKDGKKVRGTMWLCKKAESIELEEILKKMTGGKFEAKGKLKELLENQSSLGNKEKIDKNHEFSQEEMEIMREYSSDAKKMIKFITNIDYVGKYGYDKKDVKKLVEIEINRYWNNLEQEIQDDGIFDSKKTKLFLEGIKKEIS